MGKRIGDYYQALMGETDGILVTIGDGCIRWVSPEVRSVLGYAPKDIVGRSARRFLAPRDGAAVRWNALLPAEPGVLKRSVQRVRHANGSYRTMEVVGRDLRDRPGIEAIVLHLRDVTDERQVRLALAESEARLDEAYRLAGLGWWQLDPASGEVRMSAQLVRLAGWRRQPAMRWREIRHLLVHPDDLGRVEESLAVEQLAKGSVSIEHRVVRPDGSVRHWLLQAQGIRDGAGRIARITGTVMDVTETRQAEAEIFRAQKLEALDLLAAGIAHDFNNLLSVIQGNISLAKQTEGQTELLPLLQEAEAACDRAAYLAHQLSRYARSAEARAFEPTELRPLLHEVIPLLLRGTRVRGEIQVDEGLRPVHGDAGELAQVLQNIVLNAVAAMPAGGVLRAEATNVRLPDADPNVPLGAGAYVRLVLADSGRGIAPEHLPRIFDPYFTTRPEGHGLGLATTHRIVRRHEGHIRVESRAGQGTTFTIHLPAVERDEVAVGEANEGRPRQAEISPGLRVLLVDDEAMVRNAGVNMLKELGCHAEIAAGSEGALAIVRRALTQGSPIQVAILDVTLPGDLCASDLFRELWALDPNLRGVVSSGYTRHEAIVQYRRHGFRAALPKPYGLRELQAALDAALSDDQGPL